MDEQNRGWAPVGQGQPGSYGTPAQGGGAPGYAASGGGYPPPPPPGSYGTGPGGYPPPVPPPYGVPPVPPPPGQGLPPNTAALLSYMTFIPAIIFLIMDPYKRSNFVRFHSWQCIVLTCASIVFGIAVAILSFVFVLIHVGILNVFLTFASWFVDLAFFIFWLIAVIKASKGERYHIPVVGGIAERFTGQV